MKRWALILSFLSFISLPAIAQVRLPRLIGDGMVLQRDAQVKIWGWAAPHEEILIGFRDSVYHATASEGGEWSVGLPSMKAGGPFTMTVNASNTITISNILIGDVWLCSGQSNMELPMKGVSWVYETEIAKSENTYIRYFAVPQKYSFNTPEHDFGAGNWESPTPMSVLNFSAVAYFFGTELYNHG
jgi:sialate O-acetylesterase